MHFFLVLELNDGTFLICIVRISKRPDSHSFYTFYLLFLSVYFVKWSFLSFKLFQAEFRYIWCSAFSKRSPKQFICCAGLCVFVCHRLYARTLALAHHFYSLSVWFGLKTNNDARQISVVSFLFYLWNELPFVFHLLLNITAIFYIWGIGNG